MNIKEQVKNRNRLEQIFKNPSVITGRRSEIYEIIPELRACGRFNQYNPFYMKDLMSHQLKVVKGCNSTDFNLCLAALLHDIGKTKCLSRGADGFGHCYGHPYYSAEIVRNSILGKRIAISKTDAHEVLDLILKHDEFYGKWIANEQNIKEDILKDYNLEFAIKMWKLCYSNFIAHVDPDKKRIEELAKCGVILAELYKEQSIVTRSKLAINGVTLRDKLGINEGRSVGIILNQLVKDVNLGKVNNNTMDLINYLKSSLKKSV